MDTVIRCFDIYGTSGDIYISLCIIIVIFGMQPILLRRDIQASVRCQDPVVRLDPIAAAFDLYRPSGYLYRIFTGYAVVLGTNDQSPRSIQHQIIL
jgi:hypothetical protein